MWPSYFCPFFVIHFLRSIFHPYLFTVLSPPTPDSPCHPLRQLSTVLLVYHVSQNLCDAERSEKITKVLTFFNGKKCQCWNRINCIHSIFLITFSPLCTWVGSNGEILKVLKHQNLCDTSKMMVTFKEVFVERWSL